MDCSGSGCLLSRSDTQGRPRPEYGDNRIHRGFRFSFSNRMDHRWLCSFAQSIQSVAPDVGYNLGGNFSRSLNLGDYRIATLGQFEE